MSIGVTHLFDLAFHQVADEDEAAAETWSCAASTWVVVDALDGECSGGCEDERRRAKNDLRWAVICGGGRYRSGRGDSTVGVMMMI